VAQSGLHSDIGAFEFLSGATASFTASNTTPLDGEAVTFTNTSFTANASATISFFWDFGDGTTSADTSPIHSFAAPDHPRTYAVSLNIVDSAGSADEASATVTVHPSNEKPAAVILANQTS